MLRRTFEYLSLYYLCAWLSRSCYVHRVSEVLLPQGAKDVCSRPAGGNLIHHVRAAIACPSRMNPYMVGCLGVHCLLGLAVCLRLKVRFFFRQMYMGPKAFFPLISRHVPQTNWSGRCASGPDKWSCMKE